MSPVEAVALAVAAVIAAVHVVAPRLWAATTGPRSPLLSVAGGVSVAFVFVHLLPELSRAQDEIGDAAACCPSYLLVEEAQAGAAQPALFGLAMGLHLLVIDEALREQHQAPYERAGRFVLAAGVLVGWTVGMVTELDPAVLGLAIAFLAGGIILNISLCRGLHNRLYADLRIMPTSRS